MFFTVDASVWVSDALPNDAYHADSALLLDAFRDNAVTVLCPRLAVVETVASVVRVTGDQAAARNAGRVIRLFPGIRLISLTKQRSEQTAIQTETTRLRGADAVYANVAQEFGATLITWDKEMHTRAAALVPTLTPTEWLAQQVQQAQQSTPQPGQ